MTLELRGEKNYAAKVIRVRQLLELPGLDNLRGVPVDGYMALVSKDTPLDSLMVMFPAEAQLAPHFARHLSLYRKPELNVTDEVGTNFVNLKVDGSTVDHQQLVTQLLHRWRCTGVEGERIGTGTMILGFDLIELLLLV